MGLFKRSGSVSSGTSSLNSNKASESSSATSASLLSKSSTKSSTAKVKPSELPFAASTSPITPNSRILSPPAGDALARSPSASTQSKTSSPPESVNSSVAAGSSVASPAGAMEEDSGEESDEEEEATAPAPRNGSNGVNGAAAALAVTSITTSGHGTPSSTANASQNGSTPAKSSPKNLNGSSDSPLSSSEEDEFVEARDGNATDSAESSGAGTTRRKGPLSRAAEIARDTMARDVKTRGKLGKPLASLSYEDVALSDEDVKEDITVIWKAMHLFMSSRMIEAEDICLSACDHRLYYSVGFALIQSIKSLATFEPEDLEAAIQCCRDSILIAQLLRKKDHGIFENVGRIAKGSTSVNSIKSMTKVQRHAELVYSECTLLKAVLGIIYSGDFVAFLKEALNMRNAYAIYRTLAAYVEAADTSYGGEDPSIDQDFRSGVFLGNGLISLILSLLPSAVLKIMTVFGFTGDREYALATLMKGGRWKPREAEPGMPPEEEGIRRPICDMVLLMHHLVIANYLPVGGVDVPTAAHILKYNLDRYPNGIFFLYFAGRLNSTETQLEAATKSFHQAIAAQREYIQLGHICYWDLGLVSLAMGDYVKGYECYNILDKESNWSKAIYAYAKATTLYEEGTDIEKANDIMKTVPDLMQRIAGKSIPLEKFVARRARKFIAQGNRLTLPGIELAYVLNCLGLSPRFILFDEHLDQVSTVLAELHQIKEPSTYGKGDEFWDDYCLAHLLRGIILHFIAHPEPHVKPRPAESPIPVKEADEQALISFNNVLKHGRDIQHDHHLVWFAHYELGRLYGSMGEYTKARQHYEMVMSGKGLEISHKKGKGKVSLQNMAVLRSNSALTILKEDGH
ncbi:hypothetical protein BCR35DRAFT_299838 [Leucosporidium creatinivorum]|uniref:Outer membrane protein Iml2/Tetratricopeptide repeat protein 39 n=1 Tax=Leucosporidium creatinivorum TaxID=106004 RepID=A0A1Y2G0S6_9BASI|nr:hypothetical protein BCR35DRAFT_299838 [Leucosporidium creatinivorum]